MERQLGWLEKQLLLFFTIMIAIAISVHVLEFRYPPHDDQSIAEMRQESQQFERDLSTATIVVTGIAAVTALGLCIPIKTKTGAAGAVLYTGYSAAVGWALASFFMCPM